MNGLVNAFRFKDSRTLVIVGWRVIWKLNAGVPEASLSGRHGTDNFDDAGSMSSGSRHSYVSGTVIVQ